MIAVDTNVLVYAHRREAPEHRIAVGVIGDLARGTSPWAIPWPCIYEFFSVVTNVRLWKDAASTPAQAWAQIMAWTESPSISLLAETEEFRDHLQAFSVRPRVRGPVIHDARVAAICVAHAVEALLTRDRDFSLFPELAVRNPFTGKPRAAR